MAKNSVSVSIVADTRKFSGPLSKDMATAAAAAEKSASRIDSAFDGTADGADHVASKGAQVAGALGGLGGLIADQLGFPALGQGMQAAGTALQGVADAGDLVNGLMEGLKIKTIAAKVATVAHTVATNVASVATRAFGAAIRFATGPVGLIIAGITLLVGALVWFFTKTEVGQKLVKAAWAGIQAAAKAVVSWFTGTLVPAFSSAWNRITGFFSAAGSVIKGLWNGVVSFFSGIPGRVGSAVAAVGSFISSKFSAAKETVQSIWNGITGFFSGIPGKIGSALSSVASAISAPFRTAFSGIKSVWNSTIGGKGFSIPGWVPGIGGKEFRIPRLATGGITTGPTLAMIGDNPGGREAVIPLDKYPNLLNGGNKYYISVTVPPTANAAEAGKYIVQAIDAYERGGGRRRA